MKAYAELSERASENFSTRHSCPRQNIKRVYPVEYGCRCSSDTSCSRVWVFEGCGKKDVYRVDKKDIGSSFFIQKASKWRW